MNTSNYDPKTKDLGYDNSTTFSNAKFGELVKRVSALESGGSGSGCECTLGWQKLYEGTFTENDVIVNPVTQGSMLSKIIRNSELGGVYDEYYFTIENVSENILSNLEFIVMNDFSNDPLGPNLIPVQLEQFVANNGRLHFLLSSSITYNIKPFPSSLGLIVTNGPFIANNCPIKGSGVFYDKVHFIFISYLDSTFNLPLTIFGRKKIANAVTNEFSDAEFIGMIFAANAATSPITQ